MQQVADWLEKLGLGQYAQRFAENDIDVSVLPHLNALAEFLFAAAYRQRGVSDHQPNRARRWVYARG